MFCVHSWRLRGARTTHAVRRARYGYSPDICVLRDTPPRVRGVLGSPPVRRDATTTTKSLKVITHHTAQPNRAHK